MRVEAGIVYLNGPRDFRYAVVGGKVTHAPFIDKYVQTIEQQAYNEAFARGIQEARSGNKRAEESYVPAGARFLLYSPTNVASMSAQYAIQNLEITVPTPCNYELLLGLEAISEFNWAEAVRHRVRRPAALAMKRTVELNALLEPSQQLFINVDQ